MGRAILDWLMGNDTGLSSKAIALVALGGDPAKCAARYPSDGADFGRCHRLLIAAPEARAGLDRLTREGGPYWAALGARWTDLTAAYEAELTSRDGGTYKLMQAILRPVEDADSRFVRMGNGMSMRFGA